MENVLYIYSPKNTESMIRTRFKKILLVAPDVVPDQLLTDYKNVKHITTLAGIFPGIFELNPNIIVFDYDYVASDIEKIIRRIKMNKFYNKLKICCYKSTHNTQTDELLKALGVDEVIYREDLAHSSKSKTANPFNTRVSSSIIKLAGGIAN